MRQGREIAIAFANLTKKIPKEDFRSVFGQQLEHKEKEALLHAFKGGASLLRAARRQMREHSGEGQAATQPVSVLPVSESKGKQPLIIVPTEYAPEHLIASDANPEKKTNEFTQTVENFFNGKVCAALLKGTVSTISSEDFQVEVHLWAGKLQLVHLYKFDKIGGFAESGDVGKKIGIKNIATQESVVITRVEPREEDGNPKRIAIYYSPISLISDITFITFAKQNDAWVLEGADLFPRTGELFIKNGRTVQESRPATAEEINTAIDSSQRYLNAVIGINPD